MEELEKNINKRKIYISLLVSVICIIGVSYAFFVLYLRQTDNNSVTALSCFTSTLTEENSAINLSNEFPIKDEDGIKKTPFTFKITNNCNNYVKAYITIDPLKEGTANYILSKYMKANVSTKGSTDGTSLIIGTQNTKILDNKHNGYIVKEVGLNSKESKEFDLRLWIDYDTTKEQAAGMTYLSQVVIVTEPGKPTFAETILANNEIKTPITTPGAAISTADEALLASAEDDYGTSYYFRGAVTNNYVEFANKCWRIVRVGGDGSVKLILHNDNINKVANPCDSANNSTSAAFASYTVMQQESNLNTNYDDNAAVARYLVTTYESKVDTNYDDNAAFVKYVYTTYKSTFNTNYDDNAYVGFKYGTVGASTYEATHANTNKSTILTNLETWYTNNLKTYESVIDDNVWCNDKTNVTDTSYDPWSITPNGKGYAKNVTYYGATQRLVSKSNSAGGTGPSLKCNGELSKINLKVGLITADELAFAGYAKGLQNTTTYLQENATDTWWWSLSPSYFNGSNAYVWGVGGGSGVFGGLVSSTYGVRPSISLKSTTNATGNGTSSSPFIISM